LVQGGLYLRSLRPFARLDRRSHAGAARGRARARYGLAVRLLQPEIMAVGHERERSGAKEPRAARRGDDPRRLSALRQGVVALHAQQRAVPGDVFRFSGPVRHWPLSGSSPAMTADGSMLKVVAVTPR